MKKKSHKTKTEDEKMEELRTMLGNDLQKFEKLGLSLEDLYNIAHGKMKSSEITALPSLSSHENHDLYTKIADYMVEITSDDNILTRNNNRVHNKISEISQRIIDYKNDNHGRFPDWDTYLRITSDIIHRTITSTGGKKSKKYRKNSKKSKKYNKKSKKSRMKSPDGFWRFPHKKSRRKRR